MSYRCHADLGGREDSRAVIPEAEGELFHADWEPRVLAMSLAMGATGLWNIDMARAALETLVAAKGAASLDELALHADAWREAAQRTPHGQPIEPDFAPFTTP